MIDLTIERGWIGAFHIIKLSWLTWRAIEGRVINIGMEFEEDTMEIAKIEGFDTMWKRKICGKKIL